MIIAGSIGYFVMSQSSPEPAPVTRLSKEVGGNAIHIYHNGGDTIVNAPTTLSVKLNGNNISSDNITVAGGDNDLEVGGRMKISADFSRGDELTIVHKPSNSILLESTIEKNPPGPSPTVFIIDTFEDGNIAEYSGSTSGFAVSDSFVHDGSYGLEAPDDTGRTQIFRDGFSISQGDTITYWQYVDSNSWDEPTFQWGPSDTSNYAVSLDPWCDDVISIAKDVTTNDGSGTILKSEGVTFDTQWYKVRIDWKNSDNIAVTVYESDGSTVFGKISVADDTYESADTIGFGYWNQHGGWDTVKVSG